MFALPAPPPEKLEIGGGIYRLVRVLKHDFLAATCLYELAAPSQRSAKLAKVVVKFGRSQDFCGLSLGWVGEFLVGREEAIYKALAGLEGVPRWLGRVGRTSLAIEYIEGQALDRTAPPPGFFDALRVLLDAVHARGVAYGDTNKRSNILIDRNGKPYLVDFQISLRRRDDLPWPLSAVARRMVHYIATSDLYHLYKHKRRLCPQELTAEEEALSRRRPGLYRLHRKLGKPYRTLRRLFLNRQFRRGLLVSPTAGMEDDIPEKATWQSREKRDAKTRRRQIDA
jgi:hypothetical protein